MSGLPTETDVIVVGAGVAGLSAASALSARGVELVVLEAADHTGGRCVTDTTLVSQPFDKGASWLHSAQINPLARLGERMDVEFHKSQWVWEWVHGGGHVLNHAEVEDYNIYQDTMWDTINQAAGDQPDCAVASVLPDSPWRETAKHFVAQMQGGDADVVSVHDVAQYKDAQGDWLVAGGLGAFVQSLFAEVPVHVGCPVSKIDTSGPGVKAVTHKGTISANQLVLTVSTGVLAAETISFTPALPTCKQQAIENLPMGLLNKVALDFDPNWTKAHQGQIADYHTSGDAYCTILFGFYDTSVAIGFLAGRFADQLEQEGPGAATEFCLQGLSAVFGNGVRKHVRKTAETAWRNNPLTLGSYSYARPGGAKARRVLAEPVDNKLFFAGEATVSDAYATVHGAFKSGQRAAREVLGQVAQTKA
ncbi:MAG: NAD(P)/FAD-dependent oxidoreductase [Pseudomonadota bacterium]